MAEHNFDDDVLGTIRPFCEAGFALHWLHTKEKRPIGDDWASKPVASIETLIRRHRPGNNLGLRLGEPSRVGGGYLHVVDVDIRDQSLADQAREELDRLLPGIRESFPSVISGSGGASRHYYLITDRPFSSKKLAKSPTSKLVFDPRLNRDVKKNDWEIELFGTGKQVAMPPSIHPDTGNPYVWERSIDLLGLSMGVLPWIVADQLEKAGAPLPSEEETVELKPRLGLDPEEAETILDGLPLDQWCEDRDGWVQVGMALHHEFGEDGYDIWSDFSRQSEKFDEKTQRTVWKSFKDKPKSFRMASLIAAARAFRYQNAFEEAPDSLEDENGPETLQNRASGGDFLDLLGPTSEPEDEMLSFVKESGESSLKWTSLLHFNEEGALKPTLHNLRLIAENDVWLKGMASYNEFTQETVQRGNPGRKKPKRDTAAKPILQFESRYMQVMDTVNGDLWTDYKDNAIRALLEAPETQGGYGIKVSDRDLRSAIDITARLNCFHPVREYLSSLRWDGVPRLETLFVDYLGAPDNPYSREVAKLMMVAAVTRAHEPGHKFDFAVILEGLQGKRKSTFIAILAKSWFAELDGDFSDTKEMVEQMQGAWILEIPELSGFARSDVRHIKAIISRQEDKVRLAYAKRAQNFPRQQIFIGSTNDREYLRDDTGGRRFWPVACNTAEIDTDKLTKNIDQLWAEAFVVYRQMRERKPFGTLPLYLSDINTQKIALGLQESRRIESADDALAGQISAWLDRPINDGGFGELDGSDAPSRYRTETCLLQIWLECMQGDRRAYSQQVAQMIGRAMRGVPGWEFEGERHYFPAPYGRQRRYYRIED